MKRIHWEKVNIEYMMLRKLPGRLAHGKCPFEFHHLYCFMTCQFNCKIKARIHIKTIKWILITFSLKLFIHNSIINTIITDNMYMKYTRTYNINSNFACLRTRSYLLIEMIICIALCKKTILSIQNVFCFFSEVIVVV